MTDIRRERVTWIRSNPHLGRHQISHPTMWIWTDDTGTERFFDTKAEAVAAAKAYSDEGTS